MQRPLRLLLSGAMLMSGCATVRETPERPPSAASAVVPAGLGVIFEGELLKRAFAEPDRARLGMAPGQFFSSVALLPAEARYIAPQDAAEQFGSDLLLRLQMADADARAAINPIFFAAMPLTFFLVFTPMVTVTARVRIEAGLRDARSGRLVWAETIESEASQKTQGVNPGLANPIVTQLAVRNALADIMARAAKAASGFKPGMPSDSAAAPSKPAPKTPPVQAKKRYAVVIGIEDYRERLPKAPFGAQDAAAVAELLTRQGYPEENVVLRLNDRASKSDLEKYLEPWLRNHVDADSSLLVYFSGHGAPQASTGDAYLVPWDADPAYIEQTGYALSKLYQTLESLPAKRIVVVLDACFSGAGGRSVLAPGAKPLVMVKPPDAGRKVVVMSATSGNHISLAYEPKQHGLFTYFMLQGLGGEADVNGDGAVDVQELFEFVKPQVQRLARRQYNTEQVPQLILPSALLLEAAPRLID